MPGTKRRNEDRITFALCGPRCDADYRQRNGISIAQRQCRNRCAATSPPDPVFAAQLLQSLFSGTRSHPGNSESALDGRSHRF